jgi:D-arabinose 1-dehydrogenase-like Zn-dependent alcohol dehydrogenase
MKAALYFAPGDIRVEEVPDQKCLPEGVIVKVGACGVCTVMDVDAWIRWAREGEGTGLSIGHLTDTSNRGP